ncbi:hypothetical protein [Streptomyces indicus]|uniref:Uncharacterized protein n=1 Tax=Streptomyces indicus TaxID=417292 RepID=A0A1G9CIX8_9ACTN|nr:hypothetical protein [Streptomyces indicus]SDK51444.1 hypothetical protein SAMN05421806_108150 [Streptomyces indicus]
MRAIRPTVRTAAVATGVIAAFAVSTGAALAMDQSPAPAESAAVSPRPDRVRVTMPDGRVATLTEGGAGGPRADLAMPNGNPLGSLDAKHPSALNDGWTYKLVQDGRTAKFVVIDGRGGGCSWVYDFGGRLIEKYSVDRGRRGHGGDGERAGGVRASAYEAGANSPTTPLGSVRAGVEEQPQEHAVSAPLVAAGGGLAAAGAAGLGFAVLRRRTG